jgi:hypothetical protein
MKPNLVHDLAGLDRLSVPELRHRYATLFGESTWVANRAWLVKRSAWRLQALAEGDLSERARRRAAELANDADLRLGPPRPKKNGAASTPAAPVAIPRERRDGRLPRPGALLTRAYKGQTLQVQVLADGFEFEGKFYDSLSAVARAITGSHCSGYWFFALGRKGGSR